MNKKRRLFFFEITVMLLIIVGYVVLEYGSAKNMEDLVLEREEDAAMLSSYEINSQLSAIAVEERVVSQTMSGDTFLKNWTKEEDGVTEGSVHAQMLYDYLKNYHKQFDYSVVFFVSEKTGNYYYQDGFNKKISPKDEFDSWYYNFTDLNQQYDIQVDRDETNDFAVSIFVNARVEDSDGRLIGVVGVGRQLKGLQKSLEQVEEESDSNIYIMNIGNAHNSYAGNTKYFKQPQEAAELLDLEESTLMKRIPDGEGELLLAGNQCIVIRTNEELGWNIVAVNSIQSAMDLFAENTRYSIVFLLMAMLPILAVSALMIGRMASAMDRMENLDDLTGIPGRKLFSDDFIRFFRKNHKHKKSIFIIDVDNFKQYNDSRGHLYGDMVLRRVAEELKHSVSTVGEIGRWGGDEFIGMARCDPWQIKVVLDFCNERLQADKEMYVSLSIGIAEMESPDLSKETERADQALYKAKEAGKARSEIYDGRQSKM